MNGHTSEYELQRLKNINENKKILASLGLDKFEVIKLSLRTIQMYTYHASVRTWLCHVAILITVIAGKVC